MTTPTFAQRCAISEQCLPDAPYRAMLTKLHAEMLAEIGRLQAAQITREQHIALRDAFAAGAVDAYFEVRKTQDTHAGRQLFEHGFVRGFDSHERALEIASKNTAAQPTAARQGGEGGAA